MPDREKVIKGLECCTRYEVGKQLNNCWDCPYVEPIGFNQFRCKSQEMKEDALALLKQEKQKFFDVQDDWFCVDESGKITQLAVVVYCKDCIWFHRPDDETKRSCKCNYHGCVTKENRYCWWGEKDG